MISNKRRVIFLIAFFFSGASALIYEVAWTRALSLILGSSVYALSTMLATFMAGLAIGAFIGGRIADRKDNLGLYFGVFECIIGLMGVISVPIIYNLSSIYFHIYSYFHRIPVLYFFIQFFLASLIMLIPTTLMGATFPIVSRLTTENLDEMGKRVGIAYTSNTLGAIMGSIISGFVLIPLIGVKGASITGGLINIAIGTLILFISGVRGKYVMPVIMIFIIFSFFSLKTDILHPFANFYMAMRFPDWNALREAEKSYKKIYSGDYAQGHITFFRDVHGFLIIQHGGKMEGTGLLDLPNTLMLITLPASVKEDPEDILVIGLGSGVTVDAAKKVAERVEVVEINPGIVDGVRRFGNPGILDGVKIHLMDARRFFIFNDRKYDIITSEPSVPSEAMSAHLFTYEFYREMSEHLKEGGIACQWFPGWALRREDARIAIKTFASVFPHVRLWRVMSSSDFLMIGSKEPFRLSIREMEEKNLMILSEIVPSDIKALLDEDGVRFEEFFKLGLIRDENSIKEILAMDLPLNTDDRPIIEFRITWNLLHGKKDKRER